MLSIFWVFVGGLVGLLIVSVFVPPIRNDLQVPLPGQSTTMHTGTGCVKFKATEVPCTDGATSLNFIASQHK
jgi:hypothetical protein